MEHKWTTLTFYPTVSEIFLGHMVVMGVVQESLKWAWSLMGVYLTTIATDIHVHTLEGMHPTLRHVPPNVTFFSTHTVWGGGEGGMK